MFILRVCARDTCKVLRAGGRPSALVQAEAPAYCSVLANKQAGIIKQGCLVLVGKDTGIELDAVGRQLEPYPYRQWCLHRWRPCGVTWDADPEHSWY